MQNGFGALALGAHQGEVNGVEGPCTEEVARGHEDMVVDHDDLQVLLGWWKQRMAVRGRGDLLYPSLHLPSQDGFCKVPSTTPPSPVAAPPQHPDGFVV